MLTIPNEAIYMDKDKNDEYFIYPMDSMVIPLPKMLLEALPTEQHFSFPDGNGLSVYRF